MGKRLKSVPKTSISMNFNVGMEKKRKEKIKSKIASTRVSIIPGILINGVKSQIAKKDAEEEYTCGENILKEDLHSLFRINKTPETCPLRRSARLSQKTRQSNPQVSPKQVTKKSILKTPRTEKTNNFCFEISKPFTQILSPIANSDENSKSLFRKIVYSKNFFNSSFLKSLLCSSKNQTTSRDFNKGLADRIKVRFKIDISVNLRQIILDGIGKVNSDLSGGNDNFNRRTFSKIIVRRTESDHQMAGFLFPSGEWQYATPPSQKLNMTLVEETAIQPAIFCNDGTGRNIYELKKDLNTNLVNHINNESIEIDHRYMQQIAEFDKENRPVKNFSWYDHQKKKTNQDGFKFNPKINPYLYEHLATVHARPRKTVKQLRFAERVPKDSNLNKKQKLNQASTSLAQETISTEKSQFGFFFDDCLSDDCSDTPKNNFKMTQMSNFHSFLKKDGTCLTKMDFSDDE